MMYALARSILSAGTVTFLLHPMLTIPSTQALDADAPTLLSIYSTKGRTEPPKGRTSRVQVTDISAADHLLQVRVISPELRDALQAGLGVGRGSMVQDWGVGGCGVSLVIVELILIL